MTLRVDEKFVSPFADAEKIKGLEREAAAAAETVEKGTGKGASMLGWYTLPEDYDREEYARIQKAAEKIRKQCDVFIVIGIGGSYLGSRAVIEFLKSPRYNSLKKDTPDVWFSGCNIS